MIEIKIQNSSNMLVEFAIAFDKREALLQFLKNANLTEGLSNEFYYATRISNAIPDSGNLRVSVTLMKSRHAEYISSMTAFLERFIG